MVVAGFGGFVGSVNGQKSAEKGINRLESVGKRMGHG